MSGSELAATEDGQAVYSPLVLGIYDVWVLGISNHMLWKCPTKDLRSLYDRNVGARHLDVGVGTGYFLDRARWPVPRPEITLADLNSSSLAAASRRIARYHPRSIMADALKPLPEMGTFGSVGLCYLLHCLPGSMSEKAIVFDRLLPLLAPGARVFGATIVQGDAPRSFLAQRLMDAYNARGIFSNANDTAEDLDAALRSRFTQVNLVVVGSVAVFEAW